ncbi:MAG: IS30 family transposase, partial [bacterium]|nr:IS30 family transposase [bacterium]
AGSGFCATRFRGGVVVRGGVGSGRAAAELANHGRRSTAQQRGEAFALLSAGLSAQEVAIGTGFNERTIRRWMVVQGWKAKKGRNGGLDDVSRAAARAHVLSAVPMDGDYTDGRGRLTLAGRGVIQHMVTGGASDAQIARAIGVHRSTVGRELARCPSRGEYRAWVAQDASQAARLRPRARRMACPRRRAAVIERLNRDWSPEQVAGDLRRTFRAEEDMWVSHETIYQALYVQGKGALREELAVVTATRNTRTSRKPRSKLPPRASNRPWIGEGNHISQRPAHIEGRAVPGHWEGDLIIGTKGATALVTLAERATRFVLIKRLPDTHDAPTVTAALVEMISDLPAELRRTLTWDQGSEMASHAAFTMATDCQVYFCDPRAPWQRGTNENTNGLIRDYFPKNTDFTHVSDDEILHAQDRLNTRPRKTLGFENPTSRLIELLNVAQTA